MGANAVEVYDKAIPCVAGADITAGQLVYFVEADSTGDTEAKVSPTAGASDVVLGLALNDAKAGKVVTVYCGNGVVELTASAAIVAGAALQSAAAGKAATLADVAQAVDEGGAATYNISVLYRRRIGKAITAASADGKKFLAKMTI